MAKKKYFWQDWQIELVKNTYDGRTETIDDLCRKLPQFPRWMIRQKAGQLGLSNIREPPWSEKEDEYLQKYISSQHMNHIAKHLGRSRVAVYLRCKRIRAIKSRENGYTLRAIKLVLGFEEHKTRGLIRRGMLPATRRQTDRTPQQGGDMYCVKEEDLLSLIIRHPELVDLRRVDRDWFIDLLTGGALWRERMHHLSEAVS